MPRWQMYFDSLSASLETGKPPAVIDWYAFGDQWNHSVKAYNADPKDSYAAALAISWVLGLAPGERHTEGQ